MFNGIRQKATVGEGGRIEILSSELPVGMTVEIIVLMDSPQEMQDEEIRHFFENTQIDLSEYRFNRDEANER